MGDIDRSQPMNHNYDHTDGSFVQKAIDAAKQYLGIGQPHDQGPQRVTPEGPKTNMQIADEQS